MDVKIALHNAKKRLQTISDTPTLDALLLLATVMQVEKSYLYAWPDKQLSKQQQYHFQKVLRRRCDGEPIAYILGKKEFWSISLEVNANTLIPRPETELLVTLTLECLSQHKPQHILELGTGTGAIALALATAHPDCQIVATDYDPKALDVAQRNLDRAQLKNVNLCQSDWYTHIPTHQFDVIVSNPPYIALGDPHLDHPTLRFEPLMALQSGPTGLEDLYQIICQSNDYLKPGGYLCLEHGYNQQPQLIQYLRQAQFDNIKGYQDLNHIPRVIIGKK